LAAITNSPSISDYRNNPTALLAAIDDFSLNEDFLISIGPQKASVLSTIVAEHKPRLIVELGGYLGYSAILFAAAMQKTHGAGKRRIFVP
jgi:catechol O-methyltransferase